MQDEKSSGSKKQTAVCRPIAQVKPRQLVEREALQTAVESSTESYEINKMANKINFNKRNFRLQLARRGMAKAQHRAMLQCPCGKNLVVRSSNKTALKTTARAALKCRKCRNFSRYEASYRRSIVQVEKELAQRAPPLLVEQHNRNLQNLVTATLTDTTTKNESQSINQQQQQQHLEAAQLCLPPTSQIRQNYLPKPTIDGKVVSMLRRLGTTLSREPQENGRENNTTNNSTTLPQIMSPTKPKSKWLRPLEDDEVLLNFNANISEVLPSLADQFTHVNTLTARKCLAEAIDLCEDNKEQENITTNSLNLPSGLTIYLH